MIFSTITRLFFEANFENSFSAIAEKNTILVYLCAASARFWWRSHTWIFRKAFISNVPWIWNSTTIHMGSIFLNKIYWLGLAVRILGRTIVALNFKVPWNWPWSSRFVQGQGDLFKKFKGFSRLRVTKKFQGENQVDLEKPWISRQGWGYIFQGSCISR